MGPVGFKAPGIGVGDIPQVLYGLFHLFLVFGSDLDMVDDIGHSTSGHTGQFCHIIDGYHG